MKALIPLENLGIYLFIFFFKSASCETEENRLRFAEYSHFYFNLCLFPAITREGPEMQRFHLNYYAVHFSREGFSLLAQTCCRRSPRHRAPTRNRHRSTGLEGEGNICVRSPRADPAFLTHGGNKRETMGRINKCNFPPSPRGGTQGWSLVPVAMQSRYSPRAVHLSRY